MDQKYTSIEPVSPIINKMEILHNKDKYDIILKIYLENDISKFGYYNYHNGYYPHKIILNLFENAYTNPIKMLNTYL